jgi:hypothetical protein
VRSAKSESRVSHEPAGSESERFRNLVGQILLGHRGVNLDGT